MVALDTWRGSRHMLAGQSLPQILRVFDPYDSTEYGVVKIIYKIEQQNLFRHIWAQL